MDHAPRNSSAHLEAEALGATPIVRQSPKHCTSALWTASQSSRRESARQISQRNVGISQQQVHAFGWLSGGDRFCVCGLGQTHQRTNCSGMVRNGKSPLCTTCYPCTGLEDEQRLQVMHWVKENAGAKTLQDIGLSTAAKEEKSLCREALQWNLLEYLQGVSGTKNGVSWNIRSSVSGLSKRHLHCLWIFIITQNRCWNSHTTGLIFFHKPQSGWDINFFKVWVIFLNMNFLV